jgi:hypothetical protein
MSANCGLGHDMGQRISNLHRFERLVSAGQPPLIYTGGGDGTDLTKFGQEPGNFDVVWVGTRVWPAPIMKVVEEKIVDGHKVKVLPPGYAQGAAPPKNVSVRS